MSGSFVRYGVYREVAARAYYFRFMELRHIVTLIAFTTVPGFCWEYWTAGAAWEPQFQAVKPTPEFGEKGTRKQEYAFGFHASQWNAVAHDAPFYYGLKEGFRVTPDGLEFLVQTQASVLWKVLAFGVSLGPVFRLADENSVDVEMGVWTGSILMANVRLPAIVDFPGNTTSRFPRFGVTLSFPIGDGYADR